MRTEAPAPPQAAPAAQSTPRPAVAEPTGVPFSEVLSRVGTELDRGQRLVDRAAMGAGAPDIRSLLAIQAGIYRYSELVELCAKVVDHAQSAIKTTLSER